MNTSTLTYRVDRREIAFLRFVIEGYDGIAVLSTLDAREGIVVLHVAPGCEDTIETIMADLSKEIMMQPAAAQS